MNLRIRFTTVGFLKNSCKVWNFSCAEIRLFIDPLCARESWMESVESRTSEEIHATVLQCTWQCFRVDVSEITSLEILKIFKLEKKSFTKTVFENSAWVAPALFVEAEAARWLPMQLEVTLRVSFSTGIVFDFYAKKPFVYYHFFWKICE